MTRRFIPFAPDMLHDTKTQLRVILADYLLQDAFKACIESEDTSTALKRTQAFDNCIDVPVFSGLDGCTETCAPTFGMLASSETPITEEPNNFGAGANSNDAAPNTSRCEI